MLVKNQKKIIILCSIGKRYMQPGLSKLLDGDISHDIFTSIKGGIWFKRTMETTVREIESPDGVFRWYDSRHIWKKMNYSNFQFTRIHLLRIKYYWSSLRIKHS